ncbi:MAG: hypothetical protein NZ750_03410 [Anaerolineae bacterium]|nr:hypothetical protein [Anaerolineae bacterium]MDW8171368.1 hypothetical protein [Anaerolineae bacterium]
MAQEAEQMMQRYVEIYRKLHNRIPQDVRALDAEWVVVNGARMRLSELEFVITQLQKEHQQMTSQKRGIVSRLIRLFSGS